MFRIASLTRNTATTTRSSNCVFVEEIRLQPLALICNWTVILPARALGMEQQFPLDYTLEGKKQLRALANLTLCHNHGIQARFKATEWEARLDHLPSTSQSATNQLGTNVPNPTHPSPPEATLQPVSSSAGSTAICITLVWPYPSEEIMTRPNDNNGSIKSEIYFCEKRLSF